MNFKLMDIICFDTAEPIEENTIHSINIFEYIPYTDLERI